METEFGERPKAVASMPSPQSEAVANELQELSLQPAPNLLPVRERKSVLQLKLQQRRSREELVKQGIMPPLKSSATFHEHRRSLERARTEDYLKRKIRSRPERSELIRMHILEETSAEPLLQATQLQLKRSRIADDLNDKISQRPGPMELIHKNILPVHSSIKQAIIETQCPKASGDNSSCDEDSNYSLSPELPLNQESPLGLLPLPSPPETLAGSSVPSPTLVLPPAPPLPLTSGSSPSLKLTNGMAAPSVQRTGGLSQIKYQPKPNADRSAQRHKKPKDNKPKIKKLKYHQYIPPDQKGDKEPPPHLDSSYAKILQQQQLFLQLQILNQQQQQQQHYNYHTILPAPPKPQTDQPPSSSSNPASAPSPPQPVTTPPNTSSNQGSRSQQSSAPCGTKPASLPPNLDEMKVAELKCELKLRSLPVSGTKNDLIERLRTYQELNGGSDTTSSPTAGGTTGPGAEGAAKSTNSTSQKAELQFQCLQTSPLTAAGSSATPAEPTQQQPMNCVDTVLFTASDHSPGAMTPEDTCFNSDPLGEMMSSPLTQLSHQSCSEAQLPVNIKEEPKCSTPAPCQFSSKASSLQKHRLVPNIATTAPVVTMDKDKMLQEKDKQIEELTRMLRQKQRLVEVLRMQLERGKSGGQVLLKVKQEPPDKASMSLPFGQPPFPCPPSPFSCDMDVGKVTVKQEAMEAGEVVSEATTVLPRTHGQFSSRTQEAQKQPEKMNAQTKQQHICLQETTLQFAQQQPIHKLLLQQQRNMQNQQRTVQNRSQSLETQQNLQKLSQQRKKKSLKQQLKQQERQQSKQHPQQLKQQILVKQQKSLLQQQNKQQPPQVSQTQLNQPPGSCPSLPLDLLKSKATPTVVTDSNGNHFLVAMTSHTHRNDASESNATNQITLQQRLQSCPARLPGHNPGQLPIADNQSKHVGFLQQQKTKPQSGGLQVYAQQPQQEVSQGLSAPPDRQPSFKELETSPTGKNTLSPSPQIDAEQEDDFIDIILQTGDMSTTFRPAPDPTLARLNPNSSATSPPPSPVQLLLPLHTPRSCDTPQSASPAQLLCADTNQHPGSGRLEDFLESTTGKPLLGVEPGGLLTLIDDLHSQMLCTPSILDHPPSPMDTSDMVAEGDHGLDSMDWLDLTMGGMRGEETPTLAPLGPQTPPSVFSADFLDSYDLQIHWDSCL